ncbi:MAG: polysaccharide deacetylase family protein [Mongoliitalea sp.]
MKSALIISLDFELHWGRFDKYDIQKDRNYYQLTRSVIPEILHLFDLYHIRATWATVGSLMAESLEEWRTFLPSNLPSYEQSKYSAYEWVKKSDFLHKDCLFAPDLVQRILEHPLQELGSHAFAHYYTSEKGQQDMGFQADLRAAKKIAQEKFSHTLRSLVFPRNQYHPNALHIAKEEGFDIVRSNPEDWYWKRPNRENLLKKIFRTGDTVFSLGKSSIYENLERSEEGWFKLPASRSLRPNHQSSLFNERRVRRIQEEMTLAAERGGVYHLWSHPHKFGYYPKENMANLQEILNTFYALRLTHGMESHSMGSFVVSSEQ